MQLTHEQEGIVRAACSDLLVSAAAGSGKTFTMSQRIVERVAARACSIDECLVLTFTDAAAANMRAKIAQKLHDRLVRADLADKAYLLEQELLLAQTQISTIHSFCMRILREHGSLLSRTDESMPDPMDKLADQSLQTELLHEASASVLFDLFAAADALFEADALSEEEDQNEKSDGGPGLPIPPIYRMSDYFGGKSNAQLTGMIEDFYAFLRSIPDYRRWPEQALAAYTSSLEDISSSKMFLFYRKRLADLLQIAQQAMPSMEELLDDPELYFVKVRNQRDQEAIQKNQDYIAQYRSLFAGIKNLYQAVVQRVEALGWDDIHKAGIDLRLPDVSARGKNAAKLELLRLSRSALSELLFFLNGTGSRALQKEHSRYLSETIFDRPQAEVEQEMRDILDSGVMQFFMDSCLLLDRRYAELKRKRAVLDFADLEHMAWALVQLPEVAEHYRQSMKEIYVDEYQDTSTLQDALLKKLACDNLFMVGDVKQSIYSFRHANPAIFLKQFKELKAGQKRGLHELRTNFRSVPGILRGVNQLFEVVMTEESGGIAYLDGHQLGFPDSMEDRTKAPLRLLCYTPEPKSKSESESESESKPESNSKISPEAKALIHAISELMAEGVRGSEIAILAMKNDELSDMAYALSAYGLDYMYNKGQRQGESRLLRLLISLLHVLVNPLQDIYLIACLRAFPGWGEFSTAELLSIKQWSRRSVPALEEDTAFCHVFQYFANCPAASIKETEGVIDREKLSTIHAKACHFTDCLAKLRSLSLEMNADDLLGYIYHDLALLERAAAQAEAETVWQQLEDFRRWACVLAQPAANDLYHLVRQLEKNGNQVNLQAKATVQTSSEPSDTLTMTTFHGSKGLEFPHVFILGAQKAPTINERIMRFQYTQGGEIASFALDGRGRAAAQQQYLRDYTVQAQVAERLRLYYVALTRACLSCTILAPIFASKREDSVEKAVAWLHELREVRAGNTNALSAATIQQAGRKSCLRLLFLAWEEQAAFDLTQLAEALSALSEAENRDAGFVWPEDKLFYPWRICFFDSAHELLPVKAAYRSRAVGGAFQKDSLHSLFERVLEGDAAISGTLGAADIDFTLPYKYEGSARSGLKYSVTELTHSFKAKEEVDEAGEGMALVPEAIFAMAAVRGTNEKARDLARIMQPLSAWDERMSSTNQTTALRLGSLLHLLMRHLRPADFIGRTEAEALRLYANILQNWKDKGLITAAETEELQAFQMEMLSYMKSELGKEVARCDRREADGLIYREIPFTLAYQAAALFSDRSFCQDDKVLVQGIIDLWFMWEGELTLLDFKSDFIQGDDERVRQELCRRYQLQLDIYAHAIEQECGCSVTRKLIWLIRRGQAYLLD